MAEDEIEEMPPSYVPGSQGGEQQADGEHGQKVPRKKSGWKSYLLEMTGIIAFALVVSILIKTFLFQAFYIPSSSMMNTLEIGDRIIVNKLANDEDDINRGDVIVFVDPGGWLANQPEQDRSAVMDFLYDAGETIGLLPKNSGQHLVKRVIGVGGDQVTCCSEGGEIMVNGEPITEPYVRPGTIPSAMEFDVIVPEGHVWVMGDNRSNSEDSRAHMGSPGGGFVPVDNIEGRVALIMYPFSRSGGLGDNSGVFENVLEP